LYFCAVVWHLMDTPNRRDSAAAGRGSFDRASAA
jgi:hypothetical protein